MHYLKICADLFAPSKEFASDKHQSRV